MRGLACILAILVLLAVIMLLTGLMIVHGVPGPGAAHGAGEQLQILPDSYIAAGNPPSLHLHLVNKGSMGINIYKIVVSKHSPFEEETVAGGFYLLPRDASLEYAESRAPKTMMLPAGAEAWIIAPLQGGYQPGTTLIVKLYTTRGNVFAAMVEVRQ